MVRGSDTGTVDLARLLEVELVEEIGPEASGELARRSLASSFRLPRGRWQPHPDDPETDPDKTLGLLIVDGLILRRLCVGEACCIELLGAGDFIRPTHPDADPFLVRETVEWTVVEPGHAAVVDHRFASLFGRWPQFANALLGRAGRRASALGVHVAVGHLTRVDERLLTLLWHLADRWGRVAPQGVSIPLRLTHELLAELIGARRPSVTTAMAELGRAGTLSSPRGGFITLHGDPPEQLAERRAEQRPPERLEAPQRVAG